MISASGGKRKYLLLIKFHRQKYAQPVEKGGGQIYSSHWQGFP